MLKKALPWLVLALVLFYIIRNPTGSAHFGRSVGSGLAHAASAIAQFFTSLAGK